MQIKKLKAKRNKRTNQSNKMNAREEDEIVPQSLCISNTNFLTTLSELKSFKEEDLFMTVSFSDPILRYLTLSFLGGVT